MLLFLTGVFPFLGHNHASAAAFLTSRHHNYHGSIIPEFLSDEERVRKFCEARQQNQVEADKQKQYKNLYNLFVQTPLMQFSPSLVLRQKDGLETILKPLLETKYFTRTLQRCAVECPVSDDLLQSLSKVSSLTKLELGCEITNQHLEIIINSFSSLETLSIENAKLLDPRTTFSISSPPPTATKSLRNLAMRRVSGLFATQFVPHFFNLKKLVLSGDAREVGELDLFPLSSSLPHLTDLYLDNYNLRNIESLKKLVHLLSLRFRDCRIPDLSFLDQHISLPRLTTLSLERCDGPPTSSFASLVHAPILYVLEVHYSDFNNDCLQYLKHMIHLRTLDLSRSNIVGDEELLTTLMVNSFQIQELNLSESDIGNQGAIARALYSTHSRLRVLNLSFCRLVDDDLNGIGALKNTLEFLDLNFNRKLTYEALEHCKDLVKMKSLNLHCCTGINDLSPLKDCLNLEELNVSLCMDLTDDSFKVFSEEPNSFPNLRVLELSDCENLTEKVFEHLSKNNQLVYQLKELNVGGISGILSSSKLKEPKLKEPTILDILKMLSSSETARTNICQFVNLCQLKGLRQLRLTPFGYRSDLSKDLELELLQELKNLEGF